MSASEQKQSSNSGEELNLVLKLMWSNFKKSLIWYLFSTYEFTWKVCICGEIYIGETKRQVGTRIKEHYSRTTSAVYHHLGHHGQADKNSIRWSLLHRQLFTKAVRRSVEMIEIQRRYPSTCINTMLTWLLLLSLVKVNDETSGFFFYILIQTVEN